MALFRRRWRGENLQGHDADERRNGVRREGRGTLPRGCPLRRATSRLANWPGGKTPRIGASGQLANWPSSFWSHLASSGLVEVIQYLSAGDFLARQLGPGNNGALSLLGNYPKRKLQFPFRVRAVSFSGARSFLFRPFAISFSGAQFPFRPFTISICA